MASFGQPNRNRPALYKPTDFANKQKRSNLSNEPKVDEPQVVVKIQQRPQSTEKDHLPPSSSSSSGVMLEPNKDMESESDDSFPQKMVGVAEKDLEKIRKLNEFMAKQQEGAKVEDGVKKEVSTKGSDAKSQEKDKGDHKEPKSGGPPANRNQRQNRSPSKGKMIEKDVKISVAKQEVKGEPHTSNKSGGTRPKTKTKQPGKPVHHPKNQAKAFNGPNRHQPNANSQFVPPNYGGRASHMQPWLTAPVVNNPGILKKAYMPNTPSIPRQMPSHPKVGNPDKSEQKRSLDFVKNFFDTDPEVLHNRKIHFERSMKSTATNNNSAAIEPSSLLTQPMYNVSLQNNHRPVSVSHNAAQLQGLMAHSSHVAAMPSSYSVYQQPSISHGGSGLASSNASIHHSNSLGSLHHGQSSLHHANTGSLHNTSIHQNTSTNSYHTINHHPTSMFQHQSTTGYPVDIYSQMAPSTMLSPGSNYHNSLSSSPVPGGGMSSGYSYSGYIPTGNQHSHIHHVQQHLDPPAIQSMMEDARKWQKTALSKCGPINSKQARSLIEQLIDGSYECMVCCETVKWNTQIWNCGNCFHIFHLGCIRKWARSEAAAVKEESGWRCPGCQNVSTRPPNKYYCFCGKVRDPDWNPRDGITPHSCGEVCKKKRVNPVCGHVCNELCHPGPCPSCPVMVTKHCPCGKTATKKRCGQLDVIKCEKICLKMLKCGRHYCQKICHEGPCDICDMKQSEVCFCGKDSHFVICGTGKVLEDSKPASLDDCSNQYSCAKTCQRPLTCGNHQCKEICHSGPCKECSLLPSNVKFCPCGKVPVNLLSDERRTTCLDSIPTCESFCGKKLQCGPKGSSHLCMMKCHTGACQPCQKVTAVQCRCAATRKEVACKDLNSDEMFLCERKCNKKRKCGRHKCNQKCCTDREHTCNIICGKKLSCGLHKCDEVCHTGFCPTCWRAGFDELPCHCGATVLYPPIACGAKPPDCNQPCARPHPCGHAPLHTCHSEESCPPCTVLTTKTCMGGHEVWKNIPCHLADVSCGRKCGNILMCEFHKCNKSCHKGACLEPPAVCNQPCPIKRKECPHPCAAPCHPGLDCPNTPCKAQVTINCRCGRKSANTFCLTGNANSEYLSFNSELLTNQLHNLQSGQSIDITSLTSLEKRPKFLDCDEECSRLERNKRLAEALGIDNAEDGHFQSIMYSATLKLEAKTQYHFVQRLETTLGSLVMAAKKSSQSQIHHAFPSMSSSQRKIIHELAEVYGCKSYSQDQEPNRNTVVIATKDSYVPGLKLSTLVERELLKFNPPPPMMLMANDDIVILGQTAPLKPILKKPVDGSTKVDYFDDDFTE